MFRVMDCGGLGSDLDLLDRSLSIWRGSPADGLVNDELNQFEPIHLDLHTAASIGQYDVVTSIINSGVNVSCRNRGGWSPLMYACFFGHDNVVNLLLDAGADVNQRSTKGQTPLMLAASCGNESVSFFLLQHNSELEAHDLKGWTALLHSASSGHLNALKLLLETGADIETREYRFGFTPLMQAVYEGHEIIVQTLIEYGADSNGVSKAGETPRNLAIIYGHIKLVHLMDTLCSQIKQGLHPGMKKKAVVHVPSILDAPRAINQLVGSHSDISIHYGSGAGMASTPSYLPSVKQTQKSTGPPVDTPRKGLKPPQSVKAPSRQRKTPSPLVAPSTTVQDDTDLEFDEEAGDSFLKTGAITMRSSSSSSCSSGGLAGVLGLSSRENTPPSDSNTNDADKHSSSYSNLWTNQHPNTGIFPNNTAKSLSHGSSSRRRASTGIIAPIPSRPLPVGAPLPCKPTHEGMKDQLLAPYQGSDQLLSFLQRINCQKYIEVFEAQDIDLPLFLTLSDADLKEIGIKLLGPRRKMTLAITRWHQDMRCNVRGLEEVYADSLCVQMLEMKTQVEEMLTEIDNYKSQVNQEQELRKIDETCLMEDRAVWLNVSHFAQTACELVNKSCDNQLLLRGLVGEIVSKTYTILSSNSDSQQLGKSTKSTDMVVPQSTTLPLSQSGSDHHPQPNIMSQLFGGGRGIRKSISGFSQPLPTSQLGEYQAPGYFTGCYPPQPQSPVHSVEFGSSDTGVKQSEISNSEGSNSVFTSPQKPDTTHLSLEDVVPYIDEIFTKTLQMLVYSKQNIEQIINANFPSKSSAPTSV